MKGQTGEWMFDRGEDIGADDTRMGEVADKSLYVGKHGTFRV